MSFLVFCILLSLLFALSRWVTRLLSRLLQRIFHHEATVIYILSFTFLPGVILHELSHLLVANILFVPTGEIEFLPEVRGSEVKMGSVAIAHTDPLRRFLVGVAPVIGGIGIILLSSRYLFNSLVSWQSALLLYIIFQIGNTMFASSKDMEGALGVGAATLLLAIVLQLLGLPVWLALSHVVQNNSTEAFFFQINMFLSVCLGLDVFFVLLTRGLLTFRAHHH